MPGRWPDRNRADTGTPYACAMNEQESPGTEPDTAHNDGGRHLDPVSAAKRPRAVIALALLVLLVWLIVAGLGGQAQGKLSGVQSNDNSTFLPKDAESTLVSEAVAGFNESTTLPYLVVVEREDGGALTPEDQSAIAQFATDLPGLALPEIGPDSTLGDFLNPSDAPTPVPSEDGKAVLIAVPLDGTTGTEAYGETSPLVEGANALREEIETTLTPAGLEAHVGGPGGLIADFAAAFAGIDGILLGVALLVVLIILLIVYRSPILPIAVLLSAVFGLSAASLVVYQLALNDVITLSGEHKRGLPVANGFPKTTSDVACFKEPPIPRSRAPFWWLANWRVSIPKPETGQLARRVA